MAIKIISTIILVCAAIGSYLKNSSVFEDRLMITVMTLIDICSLVFVGLVIWGVL